MKKVINKFTLLLISFFLFPFVTYAAGSVNAYFSGGSTFKPGDTVTLTINVGSVNGGADGKVYMFGGFVSYDQSCLAYQSISGHNGWTAQMNTGNNKIAIADYSLSNGVQNGSIGSITFKALKDCQTTVSMTGASASDTAGNVSVGFSGKSIKIYTPSNNNNLSSLSVNPGGINFNGGTSYSTSVGASTTSVTVSAAAQDAKAKISGAGNYNLNYGANNINVVVTAEDGSKKTYSINVNRKDDRSSNTNLSSLSVSNGKLSPGFSKGNTKYSMEVPFATSKLKISANPEDPKSKVSISNPDLVAEETTAVKVTVTAENGATKTYVIDVKRGKDPNKPLSNNNYLSDLSVSTGMLSPAFDKEKLNYAVYLPFEISYIEVNTSVEDTKYATIKKEGDNNLSIGNNLFKYTVTAEDGSTRVYTLTVVRNDSLEGNSKNTNTNTYLKKLTVKNGIITSKFKKDKNIYYYYSLGGKTKIKDAIPEIKDNKVTTYNLGGSFIIIVEAASGARSYYLLIEKSTLVIIALILLIIALVTCIFVIRHKRKKNGNNNNINVDDNSSKKKKKRKIKKKEIKENA
ncbi:MAG: cadherin-like beta sandwich domain-containing protein [Bacilli bacterium]|nr:cadherin-like beta sandwich domain-containing protein [Bacilli bacterium]